MSFYFDEELPAGYQDADLEMAAMAALANEREMFDVIAAAEYSAPRDTVTVTAKRAPAANECEHCYRVTDLFHNEATGLALCEACDMATDEPPVEVTAQPVVKFKKLRNGAWGVTGPDDILLPGWRVSVTKRNGAVTVVTVKRVLWSDGDKAIATIAR